MRKTIHTAEYRILLDALVSSRKAAGLTQAALASTLGTPQSFVAKYEAGERRLDMIEVIRITEALETDVLPIIRSVRSTVRRASRAQSG